MKVSIVILIYPRLALITKGSSRVLVSWSNWIDDLEWWRDVNLGEFLNMSMNYVAGSYKRNVSREVALKSAVLLQSV